MGRNSTSSNILDYVRWQEIEIPIYGLSEKRRDVRLSFTKKGINMRYPHNLAPHEVHDKLEWCKNWATQRIKDKPALLIRYEKIHYAHGSKIPIHSGHWVINYLPEQRQNIGHSLVGDQLLIKHPTTYEPNQDQIKKIITKTIQRKFTEILEKRTRWINGKTIQQAIDSVSLKYYTGRWGSCTGDRKISYSTRLALLPEKIQNMIIFHELCHLVHFDHSPDYYKLVYEFMPDYEERDSWLKKYEHVYDY